MAQKLNLKASNVAAAHRAAHLPRGRLRQGQNLDRDSGFGRASVDFVLEIDCVPQLEKIFFERSSAPLVATLSKHHFLARS